MVALQNNLTTPRWPTAFSSFLRHTFFFIKEAPIDRVEHQSVAKNARYMSNFSSKMAKRNEIQ